MKIVANPRADGPPEAVILEDHFLSVENLGDALAHFTPGELLGVEQLAPHSFDGVV